MLCTAVCPNRGYTQMYHKPQYAFTWQQRTHSYPTNRPITRDLSYCGRNLFEHLACGMLREGKRLNVHWLLKRAADVTRTHSQSTLTAQHDRGIPSVSTHTCKQRTLLKRDANRRLIGQLVVAHVKSCSE